MPSNEIAVSNDPIERLKELIREKLSIEDIVGRISKWDNKRDRRDATSLLFRLGDAIKEMEEKPWLTMGGQKKIIIKYRLQELKDVITDD